MQVKHGENALSTKVFTPDPVLQADPDRFLTPVEAGYLLGLSPKTLQNWRALGRGPRYIRHGSQIVYLKRDIDDYRASVINASSGGAL